MFRPAVFRHVRSIKRLTAGLVGALLLAEMPGQARAQSAPVEAVQQSTLWQANEDDAVFLQLVIKQFKLSYDVRGYRTDRGVCLDLADVIQSLDLPIRIDKKSRRATGWLFAEDQEFTLDRDGGSVEVGGRDDGDRRAPLANDIYDTPEGWCVDTTALSRWFGVTFTPDLFNAVVRLESETELPFIQAIERRNRAARLSQTARGVDLNQFPRLDLEYRSWRTPSVDVVSRNGVRIGGGADRVDARVELYAVGEALGASYFARLGTNETLEPQSLRLRAFRNDPEGGLLGPLAATEIAVGDVETIAGRLTGQTAIGRGAFVTNRPMGQIARFSATTLRGVLPAGWDAELYRNGQLIAFQNDRGDGRYEFIEIDLFFGRNDLEVVLYGPQGQIRRERSSIPVGLNQIEPGETYYWAGVLQNDRDLIQIAEPQTAAPQKWRWGFGIERGLDKRTSVALGAQSLFFLDERRSYLEGAISRTIGPLQLELAGAHELGAGSVAQLNALGRLGTINLGANALVTFGDFASEFVRTEIAHRAGFTFDTSLRLGKFALPIQGSFNVARQKDGTNFTEYALTTSATAGRVALSAQLAREEEQAGGDGLRRTDTRLRLLANSRIGNLRLRGNATFLLEGEEAGFEGAILRAEKAVGERAELQAQIDYAAANDEFRLTAGYTQRFDRFSLRSDAFFTNNGGVGANVQIAFSIGPNPIGGGLRITETKLARNGQAAITVFRDDNANGLLDPGEGYIKDVAIDTGLRTTARTTNENGQIIVDDLQPFRAVLVGVDESSLADPFLAPAGKGIVITPRPGIVAELQLAVSPTGEVEGMLLSASGVDMPGVALQLVDAKGNEVARTISEFDGFFLFERVPYGRYRLQVDPEAATKLDVKAQLPGKAASIELKRDQDVVRVGPITLEDGTSEAEQADRIAAAPALEPAPTAMPN